MGAWFPAAQNGNPARVNIFNFLTRPFQWGSALRGARVFHPDGVIATGTAERVAPAGRGLPVPSSDVIARVSKGIGTPAALPDLVGLAVRFRPEDADGPWDVLLVSAGSSVLGRALALRPVTSWTGQTLTTLMPLRYGGKNWWLRARILSEIDGSGVLLDDVRRRIEHGGIELVLDQACGGGPFEKLAFLKLTNVLPQRPGNEVSFDPVLNTAPGLQLYPGWLADLRARAYARSRDGRDADRSSAEASRRG